MLGMEEASNIPKNEHPSLQVSSLAQSPTELFLPHLNAEGDNMGEIYRK